MCSEIESRSECQDYNTIWSLVLANTQGSCLEVDCNTEMASMMLDIGHLVQDIVSLGQGKCMELGYLELDTDMVIGPLELDTDMEVGHFALDTGMEVGCPELDTGMKV